MVSGESAELLARFAIAPAPAAMLPISSAIRVARETMQADFFAIVPAKRTIMVSIAAIMAEFPA
jgi:hypothetical protein